MSRRINNRSLTDMRRTISIIISEVRVLNENVTLHALSTVLSVKRLNHFKVAVKTLIPPIVDMVNVIKFFKVVSNICQSTIIIHSSLSEALVASSIMFTEGIFTVKAPSSNHDLISLLSIMTKSS